MRTHNPNRANVSRFIQLRLPRELRLWIEKAANLDDRTLSAFIRMAARKEADRVLGHDRGHRRTQRLKRPDLEQLEARMQEHQEQFKPRPTKEEK